MTTGYIFLIDDDEDVLGTLSRALKRQGYDVEFASSGAVGIERLKERTADLLILDIMMPNMNGFQVCEKLRADTRFNEMPILFLSAKSSTDSVVEGLDVGGDDYIIKPFQITELNARVRALLRRSQRDSLIDQSVLTVGGLMLDSSVHQVEVEGEIVQLTVTEHKLLRHLMEQANNVVSSANLLEEVWAYPPDSGDPDLVRAHIRNLRSKIEENTRDPRYLKTVHGVGYILIDG